MVFHISILQSNIMSFEATAELYRDVPKADLLTIDFANLFDKDPKELAKLIYACERDGFFYIDLQNPSSVNFWSDLFRVDEITKKWFALPEDVKLQTPTVSLAHGYAFISLYLATYNINGSYLDDTDSRL